MIVIRRQLLNYYQLSYTNLIDNKKDLNQNIHVSYFATLFRNVRRNNHLSGRVYENIRNELFLLNWCKIWDMKMILFSPENKTASQVKNTFAWTKFYNRWEINSKIISIIILR